MNRHLGQRANHNPLAAFYTDDCGNRRLNYSARPYRGRRWHWKKPLGFAVKIHVLSSRMRLFDNVKLSAMSRLKGLAGFSTELAFWRNKR